MEEGVTVSVSFKLASSSVLVIPPLLASFSEVDNVLPKERVYYFLKLVLFRCRHGSRLLPAHRMFRTDRHGRIFLPKFKEIQSSLAAAITALLFSLSGMCAAADSTLSILAGGVQQSEDAPFVPSGFRFLPGDYLYFTFEIGGFSVQSLNRGELRKISLSYQVTPEDSNDIPLTPSSSGAIDTELNPEDKHWTPKRRASFLIPSFIGAGNFHIHVAVKDMVGKSQTSQDFPFQIGGFQVKAADTITIQSFGFLRNENDEQSLDVAAYAAGDSVYTRFEMVGFKTGPQNGYHLSYGVTVLGPDGKPFLQQPKAAELADSSFYPPQYLPGALTVTTSPKTAHGEYIVVLTVRDLIANTSYETRKAFSIE